MLVQKIKRMHNSLGRRLLVVLKSLLMNRNNDTEESREFWILLLSHFPPTVNGKFDPYTIIEDTMVDPVALNSENGAPNYNNTGSKPPRDEKITVMKFVEFSITEKNICLKTIYEDKKTFFLDKSDIFVENRHITKPGFPLNFKYKTTGLDKPEISQKGKSQKLNLEEKEAEEMSLYLPNNSESNYNDSRGNKHKHPTITQDIFNNSQNQFLEGIGGGG